MNLIRLIPLILIFSLLTTLVTANLVCNVKNSCSASEIEVIGLSARTNAHASLAPSSYLYKTCCYDTLNTTLSNTAGVSILNLSSQTNAHVQKTSETNNYPYRVALSSTNTQLTCSYNPTCTQNQTCLVKISSNTNAHISDCTSSYPISVCCESTSLFIPQNCTASEVGLCTDRLDNDCDMESDYDNSDGRHGDNDCRVGINSINTVNTTVENASIAVYCNITHSYINSIAVSINNVNCPWNNAWETDGNNLTGWNPTSPNTVGFLCNVGSAGIKNVKCYIDTSKSYAILDKEQATKQITVISTADACGNNQLDEGEVCDNTNFVDDLTCNDFGYEDGDLTCNDCEIINVSQCEDYECNNDDELDNHEVCDGNEFLEDVSNDCKDYNDFTSGSLSCTSDCNLDFSSCKTTSGIEETCGNKECDDDSGETCFSCPEDCGTCFGNCGDGIVQRPNIDIEFEECEENGAEDDPNAICSPSECNNCICNNQADRCKEKWLCIWDPPVCTTGKQTKKCVEQNHCSNPIYKPLTGDGSVRNCEVEAEIPFFSLFNLIVSILLLTIYYIVRKKS